MRVFVILSTLLVMIGCSSSPEVIPVNTLGQLEARDIRVKVFVERPAKLEAQSSQLEVILTASNSGVQESFAVKLLGVEFVEMGIGLFSSDIEYNVHLIGIDESEYERFATFQTSYPDAAFDVRVSPSFDSLPNKETMYYATEVKLARFSGFEVLIPSMEIDVPR